MADTGCQWRPWMLTKGGFGVGPGGPGPCFCAGIFSFVNVCRMFNMESRHLLNLSVQNALDCISENSSLKHFPRGACFWNYFIECAVRSPDGRYRAHIATVYYISRPPLSQNPPPASADVRAYCKDINMRERWHVCCPPISFTKFLSFISFNNYYNECRKRFGWRNRKECFEVLILAEKKIPVLAPPHPFWRSYY